MKKWIIGGFLVIGLLAFVAFVVTPYLRNEYVNAHVAVVYREMNEIADGLVKYRNTHGEHLPASLVELAPDFITQERLQPKARRGRISKAVIVPDSPFGVRVHGTNFEITCQFFGNGYTQLVLNGATREVHVE